METQGAVSQVGREGDSEGELPSPYLLNQKAHRSWRSFGREHHLYDLFFPSASSALLSPPSLPPLLCSLSFLLPLSFFHALNYIYRAHSNPLPTGLRLHAHLGPHALGRGHHARFGQGPGRAQVVARLGEGGRGGGGMLARDYRRERIRRTMGREDARYLLT
jgi:hypothetical protein